MSYRIEFSYTAQMWVVWGSDGKAVRFCPTRGDAESVVRQLADAVVIL